MVVLTQRAAVAAAQALLVRLLLPLVLLLLGVTVALVLHHLFLAHP